MGRGVESGCRLAADTYPDADPCSIEHADDHQRTHRDGDADEHPIASANSDSNDTAAPDRDPDFNFHTDTAPCRRNSPL